MIRTIRLALALAAALALAGCLTPASRDDPRAWNHAAWCGTSPPSGYCIVSETGR